MQHQSNALKEKYKSSKNNNRGENQMHAMFQEVMAQYMDTYKKKKANRKKTEAELKTFEHMNLDETSSEEEVKREEEVDDIFGNDDDSFSDLGAMNDL